MLDLSKISVTPSSKSNFEKDKKAPKPVNIMNREIRLFKTKFNDRKKERFFSELSILFSSGVDLKSSLEIIVEQQKKQEDIDLFSGIYKNVIDGEDLSEALKLSDKFTEYDYYSVLIGEETGMLVKVLEDLAKYYAGRAKQRRLVSGAMAYPVMVILTAFGAVFFMMKFMVPMFVDVFARFKGELPPLTRIVARMSEIITGGFWYFILFVLILVVFAKWQNKKTWYRSFFSRLLLVLPIAKGIIKLLYLQRFFHAMSLLTSSRLPMLRAIGLVKKMIGFYPYEIALTNIENDIIKGEHLYKSMKKSELFDSRVVSLVRVAEEVNSLDLVFDKLANQYAEELEHKLKVMGTLLEPILIIFVGLLVGIILIAMYLPMFKLSSSFF